MFLSCGRLLSQPLTHICYKTALCSYTNHVHFSKLNTLPDPYRQLNKHPALYNSKVDLEYWLDKTSDKLLVHPLKEEKNGEIDTHTAD